MKAHFLVKITSFVHVPFLIVACTNPREIFNWVLKVIRQLLYWLSALSLLAEWYNWYYTVIGFDFGFMTLS